MKRFQSLIFVSIMVLVSSCIFPEHYFTPEPECKSDTSNDLLRENQKLLITSLRQKEPNEFRYFFKTFIDEENNTFMVTNFRNEDSCFDIKILVDKWDKLSGMKKTNGNSYPNELYDLKWELITNNGKDVIRYIDMHKIID